MTQPQRPMTVLIDVADEENLVTEASAVGCTAVSVPEGYRPYGTYVYRVTGPAEPLIKLLAGWGYSQGEYTVDTEYCKESPYSKHSTDWYDCEPCVFCGDDSIPESCDCGKPGHAAGAK